MQAVEEGEELGDESGFMGPCSAAVWEEGVQVLQQQNTRGNSSTGLCFVEEGSQTLLTVAHVWAEEVWGSYGDQFCVVFFSNLSH